MTATNTAAKAHTGQDRSKPEGSAHMRPVDGARRTFTQLTAHTRLVDGAHASGRRRTFVRPMAHARLGDDAHLSVVGSRP